MKDEVYYRGLRRLSVCDVLNAPVREHKVLGTLAVNGSDAPIEQHRMTLAMSRDPRRNTFASSALAMQIAERNQDVSVVYFNTFAGRELMRECFTVGSPSPNPSLREGDNLDLNSPRAAAGWKVSYNHTPPPQQRGRLGGGVSGDLEFQGTPEHPPLTPPAAAGGEYGFARYPENTTPQPPPLAEEGEYDCAEFANLHIINVPYGEWNLADIIRTLRPDSSKPSALDKPLVILLNDFELSGFSAWDRRCIARDLIQLKEQTGATVIIFSHEMREDLKAGVPGRGALGLLAIKSGAVHRMLGEFDHLVKTRKQAETAPPRRVHEAQTQENPFVLTRNSLEAGLDLFEIPIISNQLGKTSPKPSPWQGEGLRYYADLADWTDERSNQSSLSVESA